MNTIPPAKQFDKLHAINQFHFIYNQFYKIKKHPQTHYFNIRPPAGAVYKHKIERKKIILKGHKTFVFLYVILKRLNIQVGFT